MANFYGMHKLKGTVSPGLAGGGERLCIMAKKRQKKVAVVQCNGGDCAQWKVPREELTGDCQAVMEAYPDGVLVCEQGCLGQGSCVAACKFDAIHINAHGVAEVNRQKCIGCGLCVKACPKELIRMSAPEFTIYPACINTAPGAETRKACANGCIACGICVKNCPSDAIEIIDNHAVIDEERCIACGMCAVVCPRGTILDADGIFTKND